MIPTNIRDYPCDNNGLYSIRPFQLNLVTYQWMLFKTAFIGIGNTCTKRKTNTYWFHIISKLISLLTYTEQSSKKELVIMYMASFWRVFIHWFSQTKYHSPKESKPSFNCRINHWPIYSTRKFCTSISAKLDYKFRHFPGMHSHAVNQKLDHLCKPIRFWDCQRVGKGITIILNKRKQIHVHSHLLLNN